MSVDSPRIRERCCAQLNVQRTHSCVLAVCQLWDLKSNKLLREWKEHTAEVYAIDWNLVNKEQLLSGAWDVSWAHRGTCAQRCNC